MSSNTVRSRKLLESRGFLVDVVESWNSFTKRRKDLCGTWDIFACNGENITLVQTTSRGNMSSRIHKIAESEWTPKLRTAGIRLLVHGWDKFNNRWRVKETDVS